MNDDLVGEVSPAQRFDEERLRSYLELKIEGFGRDLTVQQIKGGASNPTFKLTTQGAEGPQRYVLRKKPPSRPVCLCPACAIFAMTPPLSAQHSM
jgi:aminoglycoside phosphotransferase (APT) family kinase protein